jgi:hypothetical protein
MAKPALSPDADFERQNERATREAVEADRIEPRACAVRYDRKQAVVLVELSNGCVFGFPPERVPGLEEGTRPAAIECPDFAERRWPPLGRPRCTRVADRAGG